MERPFDRCATCNHARTQHMSGRILGGKYPKRCTIPDCDCKGFRDRVI
jgi:hypothetical protein